VEEIVKAVDDRRRDLRKREDRHIDRSSAFAHGRNVGLIADPAGVPGPRSTYASSVIILLARYLRVISFELLTDPTSLESVCHLSGSTS
jgi:hypothetical protein